MPASKGRMVVAQQAEPPSVPDPKPDRSDRPRLQRRGTSSYDLLADDLDSEGEWWMEPTVSRALSSKSARQMLVEANLSLEESPVDEHPFDRASSGGSYESSYHPSESVDVRLQQRRVTRVRGKRERRITMGLRSGTMVFGDDARKEPQARDPQWEARRRATERVANELEMADMGQCQGPTADFALRIARGKRLGQYSEGPEPSMAFRRASTSSILAKTLKLFADENPSAFEQLGNAMASERLQTGIVEMLTGDIALSSTSSASESSQQRGPDQRSEAFETLKRRVDQVRMWKREQGRLRTEVHNWVLSYRLLHGANARPFPENPEDRHARMEEFWGCFRGRAPASSSSMLETRLKMHQKEQRDRELEAEKKMEALAPFFWPEFAKPTYREPGVRGVRAPSQARMRLGEGRARSSAGGPRCSTRQVNSESTGPRGSSKGCARLQARPHTQGSSTTCASRGGIGSRGGVTGSRVLTSSCSSKRPGTSSSLPSLHGRQGPTGDLAARARGSEPCSRSLAPAGAQDLPAEAWGWQTALPVPVTVPKAVLTAKDANRPRHKKRYLSECVDRHRAPIQLPFVTGHSKKLEAAGRSLVDEELRTLAAMLKGAFTLEVADLGSNSLLTDASLAPFLRQLAEPPVAESLRQLLLPSCQQAGPQTVESVVRLLSSASYLQVLDLSHVALATRQHLPFCEAIAQHSLLERVNLADTGIGGSYVAKQCITELLSAASVRQLDLSWNCLSDEAMRRLGEQLVTNQTLRSLQLANCSAMGEESPISFFLECLSGNAGLKKLDVSMNRIDDQTCLVLEESLDTHPSLQELSLCHNPLGTWGIRSALRLLSKETNRLTMIQLEGCFDGSPVEAAGDGRTPFNASNPRGKYVLKLEKPSHRALLRLLNRTSDKFGVAAEESIRVISFEPGQGADAPRSFSHAAKDSSGARAVPTRGTATLLLDLQKCIEKGVRSLEDGDFSGFLAQYFQLVRFQPSWKKAVPMVANWKLASSSSSLCQEVFLNSLAKDFCITPPQVSVMCECNRLYTREIVCRLMSCLPCHPAARFMGHLVVPTLNDFMWTRHRMRSLLSFNPDNPTGHYKLSLDNCADYAVAEQLHLLDRWESAIDSRCQLHDTSKWGNKSHFRNERLNQQYIVNPGVSTVPSMAEWALPELGKLEFDYCTTRRPRRGANGMTVTPGDIEATDDVWNKILLSLYDSTLEGMALVDMVHRISHRLVLSSFQLRKMLAMFKKESAHEELMVMFFFRVHDLYHSKIFKCRYSETQIIRLQERLGYLSFFPFIQPENIRFQLDFAQHDQRLCGSLLCALALKENISNLRDLEFVLLDGRVDTFAGGFPVIWQNFDKVPKEGTFRCRYVCSPEDRKYELRKQNAEKLCYYTVAIAESEVMWWTGLREVPEDVIAFMAFVIAQYPSADATFKAIDETTGKGEITLQLFIGWLENRAVPAGLAAFGEGEELKERAKELFRFLDNSGEGKVSTQEWEVLEQLWREFDLSVREFMHFLAIAFGSEMETLWGLFIGEQTGGAVGLDGEVDLDSWTAAAKDIGYFGPAGVIYKLLDHSGDGAVSWDEFEVLQKYLPGTQPPLTRAIARTSL